MWTARDWMLMSTTAAAVCGLTLTAFYASPLIAASEPSPTVSIETPTLRTDTFTVAATVAHADNVIDTRGSHSFIKPGALPPMEVTVVNTTAAPATAQFKLSLTDTPPSDPRSRVRIRNLPAWSEDYSLELKPHETYTIAIGSKATTTLATSFQLFVTNTAKAPPLPNGRVPLPVGIVLASISVGAPPVKAVPAAVVPVADTPSAAVLTARIDDRRYESLHAQ
jgi:hypothetical protein